MICPLCLFSGEARVNDPKPALPTRPLALPPKWIAAACLLLVVYLLLRPWLVERFGVDLPGFTDAKPKVEAPAADPTTTAQQKTDKNRPIDVPVIPEQSEPVIGDEPVMVEVVPSESPPASDQTAKKPTKSVPSVAQTDPPTVPRNGNTPRPGTRGSGPKSTSPPKTTTPAKPQPPKLGVLKPAGRDRFESTAGLIYSQYRIDHVMEHSRDNPDKPSHGVFEGTQEEIFAVIDEAYQLSQKRGPPQVVIEDQGDRTTYTVNLNRQIGHGGGQSGARRRHPPLKMVKIVLEEDEVITAYPTDR